MKKLLVAAMMVVMASPAFAAIQNVKVSGDITTSWIYDAGLDLGASNNTEITQTGGAQGISGASGFLPVGQKKQNVFLTQTRLRVDADLSDNVSTTVGLINERAWNAENSVSSTNGYANDTDVELYLASITMREFLYSPLTLQIGRQVFTYGNGFILGDGGPINGASGNLASIYAALNERTAYDGVTATLDYKPLTISLIYFKNSQTLNSIEGLGHLTDGQSSDVYGYNVNYQLNDPMSTVIEQYGFARINGADVGGIGPGGNKGDTMYVPGLRASTNPVKGLTVQGEIAWELGNVEVPGPVTTAKADGERRDAMAAQVLASYSLPVLDKYKPTVNASWTYVSGDKNSNQNYDSDPIKSTRTYGAWDEFNTIQGAGTIYRSIFTMSDENIFSVGAAVNPLEDLTAGVTWSGLWAPQAFSNGQNPLVLLQPNGTSVYPSLNNKGYYLGNETDLSLTYNYTEDVTFGLTVGWFVPGDVFSAATHETASQAIANIGVKF
jgi:hypothetical protein